MSKNITMDCIGTDNERVKRLELIPCTTFIIVTNCIVLVLLFVNKQCHTPTYIFVAFLGIADLFVGFASVVALTTNTNEPQLDLCLLRMGITIVGLCASTLSLTCVAIDRYIAITRALRYTSIMTRRKAVFLIMTSWIIAFLIGFAPLIGWRKEGIYRQYCSFIYVLPTSYIISLFICCVFIPLTMMFIIYGVLFKHAQLHIKRIEAMEKIHFILERNNSGLFGISARNLRSIRTFAALFVSLCLTWLPFTIATIVQFSFEPKNCILKDIIGTHLLVLVFANSFLNPLIYALGTKDFRTKVKQRCCYAQV